MKSKRLIVFLAIILPASALIVFFMRKEEPVSASRYIEPDMLYAMVEANIEGQADFEVITEIDHSRLAAAVDSPMPPAHVLIWSDSELDTAILKHNPIAAIDLPLRILAYEDPATGQAAVIANSYDFIAQRYALPEDEVTRSQYEDAIAKATKGIPENAIATFPSDSMSNAGLITLDSPYDFATTEERLITSITAESDTVMFGVVDFAERAKKHGASLRPMRLILFGAPGPGGKAMASAPTLGLDAFCQKLLIWEDASGSVHVTWNDLLALAERQQVSGGLALKVINYRLSKTFTNALEE